MSRALPRPRIRELRLSGFRAFENPRLVLDDLTVLVGRNGAGKSTVVDAFELLRDALADSLENALEKRGGIFAIAHRSASWVPETIAIAVSLEIPPELIEAAARDHGLHTHMPMPHRALVPAHYGFRLRLQNKGMGFVIDKEVARVGSTEMVESEGTFDPAALHLPLLAVAVAPFRALLDVLRTSIRAYKLSPEAIRAEPPIGAATILTRDGSNAGDVLRHIEKDDDDHAWIVRHLAGITPGIVDVRSGTAAGRRTVQFFQGSDASKVRFEIDEMSDGTLRSLATLLALRQQPIPAIVCIDEIEDSIHSGALGVLLDAVVASTDRCQVLLTSHSPEALSHPAVTAQRVRVVEWRDGRSDIFRLNRGAEGTSRPPSSVGKLLRMNALFTEESPERVEGDLLDA